MPIARTYPIINKLPVFSTLEGFFVIRIFSVPVSCSDRTFLQNMSPVCLTLLTASAIFGFFNFYN